MVIGMNGVLMMDVMSHVEVEQSFEEEIVHYLLLISMVQNVY